MYVQMKHILEDAYRNKYAVMAVNSINMEMARAVISAAEENRSCFADELLWRRGMYL